jgi:glycine C-acetyltransferase
LRYVYSHNDIENLRKQLGRAKKLSDKTGGGILVITEGVFGMSGNMGDLLSIAELKKEFDFRLFVDDAHGFGTMGKTGAGAGEEQGIQDKIDLYFSTFAKSMASIGAFVSGDRDILDNLRYKLRSQIFAKSLPMPIVIGNLKRLELIKNSPKFKDKLWEIVNSIQDGFKSNGFNIGTTQSPVTPIILKGDVFERANIILRS